MTGLDSNLYLALVHHPVYNKNGEVIASAVSNLDLHDISRAAKTYGVGAFYVVTPLRDQRELVRRIVSHWTEGLGAAYNPDRRDALRLLRIVASLDAALDEISASGLGRPLTVATDARPYAGRISYKGLLERLKSRRPLLLMFGTAWGLTQEFIEKADCVLAPIKGPTVYNHLSVRSAAAIVLDRLLGTERL
ncbi:MAG: RNA methyltransferase [Thermodesulfobacteriota bacterium]|nr:RNA methyltransferase [Thermodesulfobacteriota bacterium]